MAQKSIVMFSIKFKRISLKHKIVFGNRFINDDCLKFLILWKERIHPSTSQSNLSKFCFTFSASQKFVKKITFVAKTFFFRFCIKEVVACCLNWRTDWIKLTKWISYYFSSWKNKSEKRNSSTFCLNFIFTVDSY